MGAPDPEQIYGLYTGGFRPQLVRAALLLDLFGPLSNGPATAAEVARACGADETGVGLLLDHLVSLGLIERQEEAYGLSPTARAFLLPGAPTYAGDWILAQTDPALGAGVAAALRGERPEFLPFPWQQDAWLESQRPRRVEASLALWRAAGVEPEARPGLRVVDLGCGCAVKSLALAQADPGTTVTCIDRTEVLAVARHVAGRLGVLARARFVAGDLRHLALEAAGYDAALLGYVTDYLKPEENEALFRTVHHALAPGGRLVIDVHLPPEEPHEFAATSALLAWAIAGCRPYGLADYQAWLQGAGFESVRRVGENWLVAARGR